MKAAKYLMSAAATAALAASAEAQFPLQAAQGAAPPAIGTAPPPPLPTGIAPQPAPPGGPTILDKLGLSQQQREFCRRKLCRTPFGQLMGRIRSPLTNITGGLIPPFCPVTPSLAELQDPGVIGAAAKAKLDKAGAAQRIEAIRLLATLDCTYWPEAEEALIGALRTDRNECVRFEAALALSRGCCCTCKVIVALSHTVCCSDKDGGFMEKSARVRTAAAVALEKCLENSCCAATELPPIAPATMPIEPSGDKKKEGPEGGTGDPKLETTTAKYVMVAQAKPGPDAKPKAANEPLTFADYYQAVPKVPKEHVIKNARRALEMGRQIGLGVPADVFPAEFQTPGPMTPAELQAMANKPANLWDLVTGAPRPQMAAPMMSAPVVTAAVATPAPTLLPARTTVTRTDVPMEPAMKAPTKPAAPGVAKVSAPKPPAALPPIKADMTEVKPAAKMSVPPVMPVRQAVATSPAKPTPPKPAPVAKPTPPPATAPAAANVPPPVYVPVIPTIPPQPVSVHPAVPVPAAAPGNEVPGDPIPLNLPRSTPNAGYPYRGYR